MKKLMKIFLTLSLLFLFGCTPATTKTIEKDGYYYLYFKEDLTQKIAYVKSKNLTGPYNTDYTICSLNWFGVEGSSMYRITGTDAWMIPSLDLYSITGRYLPFWS